MGKGEGEEEGKRKVSREVKVINYKDEGIVLYSSVAKLIELHKTMLNDGRIVSFENPDTPGAPAEREAETGAGPAKEADAGKKK